jgi:glucokinase
VGVLGLDVGASKLLARGVTRRGEPGFALRLPTGRSLGPAAAVDRIAEVVARARDAMADDGGVEAVGIGFPGLVDHERGVARSSVMLDGWADVPLAAAVEDRVGIPCALDNDVNAAALCEHRMGDGGDFLFVAIGTGIGGALVLGGDLRRGAGGVAGEIGHVTIDRAGRACSCGRRGCVNRYASGTAIEEAAGLAPGALPTLAAGPGPLAPVLLAAAEALGVALGSALNLLDVRRVVLGGGVAELGPRYLDAVAAATRRECFAEVGAHCQVAFARGGYQGAALGAAALARQRLVTAGQPAAAESSPSAPAYSRASRAAAAGVAPRAAKVET